MPMVKPSFLMTSNAPIARTASPSSCSSAWAAVPYVLASCRVRKPAATYSARQLPYRFSSCGSSCSALTVSIPPMYSVTKAWFRAPSRNCRSSRCRRSGVIAKLRMASRTSKPTAMSDSCQLYQNITHRSTSMKGRSSSSVIAAPAMNSRIASTPCKRATNVPVGRRAK